MNSYRLSFAATAPHCIFLLFVLAALEARCAQPPAFSAPVNYSCTNGEQVCMGDFNGDGAIDLVVSSSVTGKLVVFTNNGAGAFAACVTLTSPGTPHSIAVADFNGDGKPDILAVNYPGDSLVVWTGNGSGAFASAKVSTVSINDSYTGVAVGDFNNDGKLDLVVTTYGPQIFLGHGDGYFSFSASYGGNTTFGAATGYFNDDTNLDFVTANYSSSSMSVYLGAGNATFPSYTDYSGDNSEYHYAVAVGDFNGDGKSDLATINYYFNSVSVRTNLGTGQFSGESRYRTPYSPQAIATADFNGDGHLDILSSHSSSTSFLSILCGNGDGTFATALTNFSGLTTGKPNQCIAIADVNGDGKPDIISTCTAADSVSVRLNQTAPALQIRNTAVTCFEVKWPNWTGYTLEASTNLALPNSWTPVAGTCLDSGGRKSWTNSAGAQQAFYRLRK